MNRRNFLHCTGAASLISTGIISPVTLLSNQPSPILKNYHEFVAYLIQLNDKQLPEILEMQNQEKISSYLVYLLEESLMYEKDLPAFNDLPENYTKEFPNSKLTRIRRGKIDATILAGNPTFFTLTKGKAVLASIRLASAFFGRGQFNAKKVERAGDTFVLNWNFTWGYFQPFPENEKPNYELPFDEDRKRRKQSEMQHANAKITISENEGVFTLEFECTGTKNVPLAIEMAFRNGGTLTGVEKSKHEKRAFLLTEGIGKYQFEEDAIEFGSGHADHEWITIRGALPKPDGDCVYFTGFTPFQKRIEIR